MSYQLETERYEMHDASLPYRFEVDRRDFFKVLGGGILVLVACEASGQQGRGGFGGGANLPKDIGAWVHIGEDGTITAYTGKVEIGQGIRTSLAQVVAEELRAPLNLVKVVMADTDLVPYDQGTFGSQTTPQMAPRLRRASAAAREVLLDLAAEQLKTDRASLVLVDAKINSLSFGQLTHGKKLTMTIRDDVATTPAMEWKVEGKPAPKVGARAIVTGRHSYTPDIRRPGMLYGKVLRPASFGATIASVDTKAAEAMPGVTVVSDGNFVGVAAPSEWIASQALAAIRAEWTTTPQISNKELFESLKTTANAGQAGRGGGGIEPGGASAPAHGSIADGLASAAHKLQATYTVAYIAHAPLEPRTAVAEWSEGKLTVWSGTQAPFRYRSDLAAAFRIPEDKVRVIVPDMGSGYGGKHTSEAALEAARLAKAAGKPVRLVWTREEEFTWAYFRPAGVIEVSSGVAADGAITAWEFHNYNSGNSGIRPMYDIANQKCEFHSSKSPLKQGSYRGLAATANHFAREVHMDELAAEVKMDPLQFRLKNLKDERLRDVLNAAAKAFGWGTVKPAADHGVGIAGGFEKGSYIATCAEVAIDRTTGKVKVVRVASAFECGAIINPDQLKNQVDGSIIQGIGGAMFEAIQFENGRILNPQFSRYKVPRFSDVPKLDTVLLDRKDLPPAGAGETPIVCLAPAVSNAIFNAVGVRLRSLPMVPNGLKL